MSETEFFPSFFVVGAEKAGTTSLHNWLKQQPEVCLPRLKETHFFSYAEEFAKGVDWYLEQFPKPKSDSVMGEVCPDYMFFSESAQRIAQWNASPQLIFIFRHPVERAYSKYQMNLRAGDDYETCSFREALLLEEKRLQSGSAFSRIHHSYMSRGLYTQQIKAYRKSLPQAQYLFLRFEDLVDLGQVGDHTYEQICQFIGVKSSPRLADRRQAANVASRPRSTWVRDFQYKPNALKSMVKAMIPVAHWRTSLGIALDRWNQRPVKSEASFEVPGEILKLVQNEIDELQELTGLDLAHWQDHKSSLLKVTA